jgi:hypothetical protein
LNNVKRREGGMKLDVNTKIFDIWKKFSGNEIHIANIKNLVNKKDNKTLIGKDPLNDLCPITYKKDEYTKPEGFDYRFLFTGFNPSFNEKHYLKCKKNDIEMIEFPIKFFHFDKNKTNSEKEIIDVDYSLRNKIHGSEINYYKRYFKPVLEFICDCFGLPHDNKTSVDQINEQLESKSINHVHIDPFFIRGTVQKDAEKILFNKGELNEFGRDQFNLFEEIIESYQPTAIIAINASTSNFLIDEWNNGRLETSFDLKKNNLTTKVFCGGMLSGGRTMDNYSKQRLVKEINNEIYSN